VDQGSFAAGYQSVRRFVRHLQAKSVPEPRAVIQTAPAEDYGKSRVMLRAAAPVASPQRRAASFAPSNFP
jgi:hypothetical protein